MLSDWNGVLRRWSFFAIVVVITGSVAACDGSSLGLQDKISARVVDGQLQVISCWRNDRLVEAKIETTSGQRWSAVAPDGQGLALDQPVAMQSVVTSGTYEVMGELPAALVVGDRIDIQTEQEAGGAVLDEALLSNQDPFGC